MVIKFSVGVTAGVGERENRLGRKQGNGGRRGQNVQHERQRPALMNSKRDLRTSQDMRGADDKASKEEPGDQGLPPSLVIASRVAYDCASCGSSNSRGRPSYYGLCKRCL